MNKNFNEDQQIIKIYFKKKYKCFHDSDDNSEIKKFTYIRFFYSQKTPNFLFRNIYLIHNENQDRYKSEMIRKWERIFFPKNLWKIKKEYFECKEIDFLLLQPYNFHLPKGTKYLSDLLKNFVK